MIEAGSGSYLRITVLRYFGYELKHAKLVPILIIERKREDISMGIQINGPASGMQTDLIIQQLLSIERRPQVIMNRQLQLMQWKKFILNLR